MYDGRDDGVCSISVRVPSMSNIVRGSAFGQLPAYASFLFGSPYKSTFSILSIAIQHPISISAFQNSPQDLVPWFSARAASLARVRRETTLDRYCLP